MRNYIILNGTNSNTITGLLIQSLAPISKPLMRTEIEEIDGRDGDIITPLGFSAYDKQITIGLYGTYDINAIIAFFNSEGTVTFSNEPDKYYNYQIYDQIDFERLVRYRTATVTLHCQPFKFATTGESQTLDSGTPISAEGTNLVLEGSQLAPFSQFDLKGNTTQQTYSGKNLMDTYSFVGKNAAGTLTVSADGVLTLTGNTNSNGWCGINKDGTTLKDLAPNLVAGNTYYLYLQGNNLARTNIYLAGSAFGWERGTAHTITQSELNGSINIYGGYNTTTTFQIMITATSDNVYEPYVGGVPAPNPDYPQPVQVVTGENTVKIHGKNLIDVDFTSGTANGVTKTLNADGSITLNGHTTAAHGFYNISPLINFEAGKTYTLSVEVLSGSFTPYQSNTDFACVVTVGRDGNTNFGVNITGSTSATHTFQNQNSQAPYMWLNWTNNTTSTDAVFNNFTFRIQVEEGSTATSSEPYQEQSYPISLGSIELCKIGDYQDYIYKDGSDWKIHKAVGKAVLDGSVAPTATNTDATNTIRPRWESFLSPAPNSPAADRLLAKSNRFQAVSNWSADVEGIYYDEGSSSQVWLRISKTLASDQTQLVSWLQSNPVDLYYPLGLTSQTDTTITNAALIEQLDAIANQAHAYKTRTYVDSNAATGNVPHIIAATVVGSADGTVTNAGNIYSKPKLTIYGSGDVGVYLNGVQMLQIALGTLGNITIDTDLMEAYTSTIDNLQNRAVTGDYSNFKLAVGANKISFSGSVTSCIVENFSRWL